MRNYINVACGDCGRLRRIETLEQALAPACPTCMVNRAVEDYRDYCMSMGYYHDAESADEYLDVTNYGQSLPGWLQAKVREYAEEGVTV